MSRYKITLQPIDWFFFGGEQTFDNGISQSFVARSNRMPQQTTLLGMVRYQLLKKKHLIPLTKDSASVAETLIGPSSFNIAQIDLSFGKIKTLSPVFIQKGNRRLVPMPLNYGYTCSFDNNTRVWLSGCETEGIINVTTNNGGCYNDKDYWKQNNYGMLIDQNGETIAADDLYLSKEQIGITKGNGRSKNEDGFFKQETLRFKDIDTKFAFYLELDGENLIEDDYIFIGAQRSCFKMEVKTSDEQSVVPKHAPESILLLSPTFIDDIDTFNSCCRFHWSYGVSFRNLIKTADGKLKSGEISYKRQSSVCTMLAPGSIIYYFDRQRDNIERLIKKTHLQQIGYNIFNIL